MVAGEPMARDPNQGFHGGDVETKEFQDWITKKSIVLKSVKILTFFNSVKKVVFKLFFNCKPHFLTVKKVLKMLNI